MKQHSTHIPFQKKVLFAWYFLWERIMDISLPPMRVWILRMLGATIGKDVVILHALFVNAYHYGYKTLHVGNRCFIGDDVLLDLRGGITLEDDVTVSARTCVLTHMNVGYKTHPLQYLYPTKEAQVVCERGSYIGANVTILSGVVIGKKSVVGAGAVITKYVKEKTVVAGVPGRVIKNLK